MIVCYLEWIDLLVYGFYIIFDIGMDWDIGKGRFFSYFIFGVVFVVVEIDILIGDFYLL